MSDFETTLNNLRKDKPEKQEASHLQEFVVGFTATLILFGIAKHLLKK